MSRSFVNKFTSSLPIFVQCFSESSISQSRDDNISMLDTMKPFTSSPTCTKKGLTSTIFPEHAAAGRVVSSSLETMNTVICCSVHVPAGVCNVVQRCTVPMLSRISPWTDLTQSFFVNWIVGRRTDFSFRNLTAESDIAMSTASQ